MEYKIGELAKTAGVNIQTVRYYEKCGFLQPSGRLASGYRVYNTDALKKLNFIRYAKKIGFTLKEANELLKLRVNSADKCEDVRLKAEKKVAEIEERIKGLNSIKTALKGMIDTCKNGRTIKTCPILESIANPKKEVVDYVTEKKC